MFNIWSALIRMYTEQHGQQLQLTLTLCSKLFVLAELTMPRVQDLLPSFSITFRVFQYLHSRVELDARPRRI